MSEAKVSELRPTYGADTLQDRVTGVVFTLLAIRRMSQNQLAAELEIAPSTLSGKLGGRRRWSIDDLAELALIFGVNPQIFLRQPGEIFAAALELDGNGVTREYLHCPVQVTKISSLQTARRRKLDLSPLRKVA